MARIVLNVSSAAKPEPTGIARFVAGLVPRLLDAAPQHDFRLGIRPERWSLRRHAVARGLPGKRLRLLVPPWRSLRGRWDLLHGLGLWLPSRHLPFPALLTVHDLSTLEAPGLFRPRWAEGRARKLRELVPRADAIVTPSEFTRERVVELLGVRAERVHAIPHGIDPEWFRPAPDDEVRSDLAALGIARPYVLGTAERPRRKGVLALLDAFARIRDAVPHDLVLFGGSPARLRALLGDRPLERVHVLGYVPDAALRTLYRGAEVFAFPSLYEGFGLPVLEAMACGTPVVAPDAPVFREIAGDAAALYEAGSTEDLAAALRGLCDPAPADDLRRRGLARAATFRWEDAARSTLALYEQLLGTGLR